MVEEMRSQLEDKSRNFPKGIADKEKIEGKM